MFSDTQPSLKSNTTVLQSGAIHTIFNGSDPEHLKNENIPTKVPLATSNIQPESEPKGSVKANNTVSQNTARNRRRRNRKKRKLEQIQKPVGGEDDVLVAVSKIFKNPTDSEGCLETNQTNEAEASISNDNSNAQENLSRVEIEDTGDDFGMDFTVDFDSYPELSGTPRIGDVLIYKVIN